MEQEKLNENATVVDNAKPSVAEEGKKKHKNAIPKYFKSKIFLFVAITFLAMLSAFMLFLLDDNNTFRDMIGIKPESVAWLRGIFNIDVTIVTWVLYAIIVVATFFIFFIVLFRKRIHDSFENRKIKKTGIGFDKKQNTTFHLVFWSIFAVIVLTAGFGVTMLFAAVNGGESLGKQISEMTDPAKFGAALLQFLSTSGIFLLTIIIIPAVVAVLILLYKGVVLLFGGVAGGVAKNVMASSNFQETYAAAQAASSKINEMANQLPKTISVVSTGGTYVPVEGSSNDRNGLVNSQRHTGPIFPALSSIDKKYNTELNEEALSNDEVKSAKNNALNTETSNETDTKSTGNRDFALFVDEFQSYLAQQEKLYFSKNILRTFVAGLSASRLILLEGLSGTGKSSLPRKFQQFIGGKSCFLQVQATWRDRTDIIGYYSDLTGYYKESELLKSIYESSYTPNDINLIVLDEMNISRAEYYFADFLSIYEYPSDAWKIQLMQTSSDMDLPKLLPEGTLSIPTNIWFVGTINVDDSTFTVTDKVYDRAIVINFNTINEPFDAKYDKEFEPVSYEQLTSFFTSCQNNPKYCLNREDKQKINDLIHFLDDTFEIKVGNRIVNQIELFVPTFVGLGGTKLEALDMMLCAKIFRKLDYIFLMNMGDLLIKLQRYLQSTFKKGGMPNCEAKINSLLKKYQ